MATINEAADYYDSALRIGVYVMELLEDTDSTEERRYRVAVLGTLAMKRLAESLRGYPAMQAEVLQALTAVLQAWARDREEHPYSR